jgi:16S rRNA (guanine(966)-N(2))-methyltransferase RsmD
VLDLYAGSGALGLEALSRGAAGCTFVDADGESCRIVEGNARALGLSATTICMPVVRWLHRHEPGARYDLIFLDPPYGSHQTGELDKALTLIDEKRLLSTGGLAVAEHEWRHAPQPRYGLLALDDQRRYGQTELSFYAHEADPNV